MVNLFLFQIQVFSRFWYCESGNLCSYIWKFLSTKPKTIVYRAQQREYILGDSKYKPDAKTVQYGASWSGESFYHKRQKKDIFQIKTYIREIYCQFNSTQHTYIHDLIWFIQTTIWIWFKETTISVKISRIWLKETTISVKNI